MTFWITDRAQRIALSAALPDSWRGQVGVATRHIQRDGQCTVALTGRVAARAAANRCLESVLTIDYDKIFMRAALDAARTVAGRTGDNPPVGCVIVRDGLLVAGGATQSPGRAQAPSGAQHAGGALPHGGAHAEVVAVQRAEAAGHDLSRCEVYVILEPCSFTGRTPPCSTMLAEKRPGRVVVGVRDPHPRVRGSGLAELREAGIEVTEGALAGPVREFLADWLSHYGVAG